MPFISINAFPPPWRFGVSALLAPGAVLMPGNWWRVVRLLNDRETQPKAPAKRRFQLETIFEEQRVKCASDAPNRMACQFVCPTLNDAQNFSNSQPGRTDVWYLVEPTETLSQVFVARYNLFNIADLNEATTIKARKSADRYWTEAAESNRELLIPFPLRIVQSE